LVVLGQAGTVILKGRISMNMNVFDFLMVVALGSLSGLSVGLIIGYGAKKQKRTWSAMSRNDQTINIALVITFCAIFCAGIGYYSLV
jgi:membrane protein YqaA with SNARE-associated domain